jgi:hypothetical protein
VIAEFRNVGIVRDEDVGQANFFKVTRHGRHWGIVGAMQYDAIELMVVGLQIRQKLRRQPERVDGCILRIMQNLFVRAGFG